MVGSKTSDNFTFIVLPTLARRSTFAKRAYLSRSTAKKRSAFATMAAKSQRRCAINRDM
jgi:hypothetical protein